MFKLTNKDNGFYLIDFKKGEYTDKYSSIFYFLNMEEEEFDNLIANQFHGVSSFDGGTLIFKSLDNAQKALEWLESQCIVNRLSGCEPKRDIVAIDNSFLQRLYNNWGIIEEEEKEEDF